MLVKTIVNSHINSNTYILFKKEYKNCIVIDPGFSILKIIEFLNSNSLNVQYILLTHEHFDHVYGVNKLFDLFDAEIISSTECSKRVVDSKTNLSFFYVSKNLNVYRPNKILKDKETICFLDENIKMLTTKGHSDGSVCYIINDYLFTGDTILKDEKIITKLPTGNTTSLKKSIYKLANNIKFRIKIFPGHGDEFYIDSKQQFLKLIDL